MNYELISIQIDADSKRVWVAATSNEQSIDLMHTTTSENELVNYENDASSLMTITKEKIKGFIL